MKFAELRGEELKTRVTCGVAIFTQDKRILLVHPTGAGYLAAWSLPKGLCDTGETDAEAAIREVREETSLDIKGAKLVDHGVHAYIKHKAYHLFSTEVPTIDVKTLKCQVTFEHDGKQIVEVDKFMLADHTYALELLNKKQAEIFKSVFKENSSLDRRA